MKIQPTIKITLIPTRTPVTRKGTCTHCHTTTTIEVIDSALDGNRFYFGKTIMCPVCSLREIEMGIIP